MKKLFAILLALTLVISLCACGAEKPAETTTTTAGEELLQFTVVVVHADKSEKTVSYETQAGKLGAFLEDKGLIRSEGADDGMFHTVDGEKADWNENQSYWALYVGEEYAMQGIYDTDIADDSTYKLVYTIG